MSETTPAIGANLPEFSVSELSAALKRTVEDAFPFVRVRGEISGYRGPHASGHLYFCLKDANARVDAIIWKAAAVKMKLRPEEGLEVIATGRLTTYPGRSTYQLVIENLELAGLGALMAMLEERKKRLLAEGLFDASRKKPLPYLPRVVGVVTSPTGAVIRDIMHRLTDRFPLHVLVWPVTVQGERAAAEIAAAIRGFNAFAEGAGVTRPDVLIVARGGGSIEDLMAFNDEEVVRAAAESRIPLISAVGHETDTTLIDFASDLRAPTPTAAAELAVPVRLDLLGAVGDLGIRMMRGFVRSAQERRRQLQGLVRLLPQGGNLLSRQRQQLDGLGGQLADALRRNLRVHERAFIGQDARLRPGLVAGRASQARERVVFIGQRLDLAGRQRIRAFRQSLDGSARLLAGVSYMGILDRGFVLVRDESGRVQRRAADVREGATLLLSFSDGTVKAQAGEGAPARAREPKRKPGQGQPSLF